MGLVGGDQGFEAADFIFECRHMQATLHVAQNDGRLCCSAIDHDASCRLRNRQKKWKRTEEFATKHISPITS